ncbi:MAG: hypothetical protein R3308_03675, partial [Thiohalobacterales bacterium]|nr:hypothetical protein [Thiohalobacterales bacterium]
MSVGALASLDFSHFFLLCRQGMAGVQACCVRDASGAVLATDSGDVRGGGDLCRSTCDDFAVYPVEVDRAVRVSRGDGHACFSMAIFTPGEEFVGSLSVLRDAGPSADEEPAIEQVQQLLESVVLCIEKEMRLTAELEAMTQELVGRYEELNLVFENTDDELTADHDSEIYKKLVEDYVDYLGVDQVALVFPSQGRIFGAGGGDDPVADSYDVVRQVCESYMPQARENRRSLLLNDFNDPQRRELDLGIPYKILACPVVNSRGDVE